METQTFSKKTISALIVMALFSYQSMSAEQIEIAEDMAPTHSIIFILSGLFFIVGFIILIMLKLREDAKEKKEEDTISHPAKHRHNHPKHYGHRHQYNH